MPTSPFFHHAGNGGQQDQRQYHHQIFDNQPADGDLPALAIKELPLLKRAKQDDGTGGRQTEPKTMPVINDHPSTAESAIPSSVATAI